MTTGRQFEIISAVLFGALIYSLQAHSIVLTTVILSLALMTIWSYLNISLLKSTNINEFVQVLFFSDMNSLPVCAVLVLLSGLLLS